jgi:hypothetical protein
LTQSGHATHPTRLGDGSWPVTIPLDFILPSP